MIVCGWPLSSKAKSSGPRLEIGFPKVLVTTTSRLMRPCTESDTRGGPCLSAGISGAGAAPGRGVGLAPAAVCAHTEAAQQRTNTDGRRLEPGRYSSPSLSRNLDLQKRKSLLFSRHSDSTHIMPKLAFTRAWLVGLSQ